jgi:hypothetical protein
MQDDALDELKKRRKKKRKIEEEAEREMQPVRWRPKGRQ